ncbi:DNA-formamidopyrimidine glycosylase family protein [Micromonospora inositola]|uniref:DNA-(apurinic or apyrimidinic site) lyase n=1 Tax=Micromonospora inositola TaxID=47865 RepID=A0A1C5GQK1_9ACTN|nr:DNA-formamidopyrimidine glycosylase family protein [Micromonospora inositola]SCG35993.1 endonuclease-8 [Micromonospora inositola]
MPEGDTVWNTARVLQRALAGARLTGSDFRVPQLAATDLTGWTVRESASRGKHLLLRLTAAGASSADGTASAGQPGGGRDWTLHSHLRMDGAWRAYAPGERWAARPAHLIRVVLRSAGAVAVGYHLHELALVPTDQEESLVGHLGPDLLGPDWDPAEAVRRLAAQPDATIGEALLDRRNVAGVGSKLVTVGPSDSDLVRRGFWVEGEAVRRLAAQPDRLIGEALLDQRNLAGLGTIYTAEVLFLAGVSTLTTVGRVGDLRRVVRLARRLLWANRGRTAQVTTGDTRRGRGLWVYGRQGQPCRRCGTVIIRGQHGSEPLARLAYWCPSCQPSSE